MKPEIVIVAAMAENRVIGNNSEVPWHIREDLIRLRNLTKDQVVILGRKTYDSMVIYYNKSGRPMPGKLYIAVTHDENYQPTRENVLVVHSVEQAIESARQKSQERIFIIGGQSIFEQTVNLADKLYLTYIDKEIEGDVFFPDYSDFKKVVSQSDLQEHEGLRYRFLELER